MTPVQHALLALHEEWCGEGGTHFLVEHGWRTSVAASLREGDAAAVWGHHDQVGHSQPVTSTHFGGHNVSVYSTQTNSLMVTSEWELLLSQLHSPSQHSLPTTHCILHACTPLSAAGHMTTLLGGRSLGWLVGSFAGDAPHSTHPLCGGHKGGGDHLTPSALRRPRPTRVDQYRRTPNRRAGEGESG